GLAAAPALASSGAVLRHRASALVCWARLVWQPFNIVPPWASIPSPVIPVIPVFGQLAYTLEEVVAGVVQCFHLFQMLHQKALAASATVFWLLSQKLF